MDYKYIKVNQPSEKPDWLTSFEFTCGPMANSELAISNENESEDSLKSANVNDEGSREEPAWLVTLRNNLISRGF